ncbi:acyltransferase family protein [Luteipulveratus flavus]|uniref:Acyltransferase family protein n=1 Tax=Luteipulveratus flavus TaxID=3031728 RepID=A0ABT6C573_9MICO|nr:acyltransferase family protein [Luteipulveratus sp. YIM 133296]MDF8264094.1 acyltransferase family protein [Luteipulveratus sp. YIM 133296]
MARSRYRNRPALDGVRGIAMLTFMAFHLGVSGLQGAWVGINLFFVLSGFLIARLLIEERIDYGDIDVLGFYRRRARRLLPGLLLLLGTLCAYGLLVADDDVRRALRGDVLATLGYVMNWRLILRDDQYFEAFGNPSFLRHAWTLSVEEQFYVLVPLLIAALFVLRSRRAQVTVVLGLAVASAVWTAVVGTGSTSAQAHAYYGTDTRVQSLLVGVALALLLGLRRGGRLPDRLSPPALAVLGWGGLAGMAVAYLTVAPFSGWMFGSGGILLSSLVAAALVTACADPRPSLLGDVLGWRPLAYLGKLSYGLYLWHWPIHLWFVRAAPQAPTWLQVVIGIPVTVAVAAASYELVERRVLRGGVRALVPGGRGAGRMAVAASVTAVLAASYAVGNVAAAGPASGSGTGPALVAGTPAYTPRPTPVTVGLLGDSVPFKLLEGKPAAYSDLRTVGLAEPGCDLTDVPLGWSDRERTTATPTCLAIKRDVGARVRQDSVDVLVLMTGTLASLPHVLDGRPVGLDDPRYERAVVARLEQLRADARSAGAAQVQVVTVPCRDRDIAYLPDSYRAYLEQHPRFADAGADPVVLNRIIRSWAGAHQVPVLDLYGALGCATGFRPAVHGVPLYGDGIHFSAPATPMIWTWLAPSIRTAYEQRAGARS